MYQLKLEPQFQKDYHQLKREHPELVGELRNALEQLRLHGIVNNSYHPHILNHRGGNYNNSYEFHLSDGKVYVLVIYVPHKTNLIIRLVRIGSHNQLFHSSLK